MRIRYIGKQIRIIRKIEILNTRGKTMKNSKLYFGIALFVLGIVFSVKMSNSIGLVLIGLGALIFLSGMRNNKKSEGDE